MEQESHREEAQELRALVKRGRLSSLAPQAALNAIERERAELVFRASRVGVALQAATGGITE
jgi:hypothetical protein